MASMSREAANWPERMRGMSIRTRLLAVLVAMVLFTAAAIVIGTLVEGVRNGYRQAFSQLQAVATLKQAAIEAWLDDLQADLQAELARGRHASLLQALLSEDPQGEGDAAAARAELGAAFQESVALRRRFGEIFLMDRRGHVVLSTNPAIVGQFRGVQDYFREGLRQPGIHVQVLSFSSTTEGLNAIVAVTPVMGVDGRPAGVLAGSAGMATLNRIMEERTGLGQTGESYVVGRNHVLLTRSRFLPDAAVGGLAVYTRGVTAAIQKRGGGAGAYPDYRNVPVLGVWRWLPALQAALAVEQDRDEVLASLRRTLAIDLAMALVAVLAAVPLAVFVAASIARPVADLARTAARIAAGDLDLSVQAGRRDEVGILAEAFNSMTQQLREVIAGLEQRIADLNRTSEALRNSQALYRDLAETSQDLIWQCDAEGRFTYVNAAWEQVTGYRPEEMLGRPLASFQHPGLQEGERIPLPRLFAGEALRGHETALAHRDGREVRLVVNANPFRDRHGTLAGARGTAYDVTAHRRLQEQLQHAYQMESVGRLAGGVAHDFNNMLGVILGAVELALEQCPEDAPAHGHLLEIHAAAERSAHITQQLLAFARKQVVSPKVIDLNESVGLAQRMLQRLIGDDIRLEWQPQPGLWPVCIDPFQVDQILANLCANARDAISGFGTILIRTGNRSLDADACASLSPEAAPGDHVVLSVIDNGSGMDRDTLAHVFEPFFTTKEIGEGTGLGLAMVYGAARQNHGFVHVGSVPGQGSTFEVWLPRARGEAEPQPGKAAPAAPAHGTILLVEDEPAVLRLSRRMLAGLGYTVLAAASPQEALRLAKEHGGRVDLLLTDVVMSGMNGRDLARSLASRHPGLRILFMSGHTADVIARHGVLEPGIHFIQKPFGINELSAAVRSALAG